MPLKYHKESTTQELRIVTFPRRLIDEEIMDIKFKEMHDGIILVKTKHLNLYELDISYSEVYTLNKTTCPLETRSIFGRPDLFLLHFE